MRCADVLPDGRGHVVDEPVLETGVEHRRGAGGNQGVVVESPVPPMTTTFTMILQLVRLPLRW
jgi:hypothetical protein